MIPAIAKFMFPNSKDESPSKTEEGSQCLTVITEPHLHDEVESVQSSANLDTSGYSSMKKDELVSIAAKLGIRLDKRATKAQIIKLLATTSLGGTQQSVDSEDNRNINVSQAPNELIVPSSSRIRSQSMKSKLSEDDLSSARSSPARMRSTVDSTTGSRTALQVRTPSTRKSSRYLDKHELRSPKEHRVSHQKTLDPQFEYYSSTETSRFPHDLRSPKELQLSHSKTMDPQYEYYSGVETIDNNMRVTRSSKKGTSSTKSSRSSPAKRRRSNSVSNQEFIAKTPSQTTADSKMAIEIKGRRQSRQTSSRATPKQVSPVVPGNRSRRSFVSTSITPSVGSKRNQPSVSNRRRIENVVNEDDSEADSVNQNRKKVSRGNKLRTDHSIDHSTLNAVNTRQLEQSLIPELRKNDGSLDEEYHNNSDEDTENDEDEMAENADDDVVGDGSSETEHHGARMEQIEEEENSGKGEETGEVDRPVTNANFSASDFMAAFLAAGKDTAGALSSEVMDVGSDEDDDSKYEEDDDGTEDEDEDEQKDIVDEVPESQATVPYNFPPNGFMAAFLTAGKKSVDAVTTEVMDLMSSDDETVNRETKTVPNKSGDSAQKPSISSVEATSTTVAPKDAESIPTKDSTQSNIHPAVTAFNKLGFKLLTAATAAETQSSSSLEMLSVQEYDLLKSILNKIKPAELKEDEVGQKRPLPQSAGEEADAVKSLQDGQGSAMKRRRTSTDSRQSYDGELWNFSDPSGEDPLSPSYHHSFSAPRTGSLGVFSRSSFGGGLFGRVQTPYNHNYRTSIGSTIDSNTLPSSKAMFDRRIEEAATVFPAHTSSVASLTDSDGKKTSQSQVSFNLGSTVTLSGGKPFGMGNGSRSSYTPQFRSSSASFVSGSAMSSRDNSLLSAEESSISYLEKRRMKRQLQASASATVAKQILDTLGSLSSPLEKQAAPVGLLTQEADILESGSSKIPDFQLKRCSDQQKNALDSAVASNSLDDKHGVSFAAKLGPTSKISIAVATNQPTSKSTGFFAPPTPLPTSSTSSSTDRRVKFAADPVSKSSSVIMTPAAKGSVSIADDDEDFGAEEDDDQIIVEKRRSSLGSIPFKSSLTSSPIDNDEFSFDEPLTVKGVDESFAERESITNIRYAFTPPSKLKRPKSVTVPTPAANGKAVSKPLNSSAKKEYTSASGGTSIWNMKSNPNEKKCQTCLVSNDKSALKCESCGSLFPVAAGTSEASSSGSASVTNIWNLKANPNEKKCQVCLVKNDKSAIKCESCGSMFPIAEGTTPATTSTAPSLFASSASTSSSNTSKPAVGGFTFGITPGTTPAVPVSGTAPVSSASFTFGITKPAASEGENKATVPISSGTSFFSTPVDTVSRKDSTSTAAPASVGFSFGAPTSQSSETTSQPSAFSVGFSGFSPTASSAAVDNKSVSRPATEEVDEEQPTRKRRVQEEETSGAPKSTASMFGGSSAIAGSSAPIVFGVPSAGVSTNSSSSSAASSVSFGAPGVPATEEKKKDEVAVKSVGSFGGFGATFSAPGKDASATTKPSFAFGTPAAASATANDSSKPAFGAAPPAPVVKTAALPSFASFGSVPTTLSVATPTTVPKESSSDKPGFVPFGGSVPTAASTNAAALPLFGSASRTAPFNAFAPVPASSSVSTGNPKAPSVQPVSSGPFGGSSLPQLAPTVAPSNPFGAFATPSVVQAAPLVQPSATMPPVASFDTSSTAAVVATELVFKPPASAPFGAPATVPAPAASASNPFATSFGGVSSNATPAAAALGPFGVPAVSASANPFTFTSAAAPPAANPGPFGSAAAPSTNAVGPFGSSAAALSAASNPFVAASAPTPSMTSNPFGSAVTAASVASNPFGGFSSAHPSSAGMLGAPAAAASAAPSNANVFAGSFGQQQQQHQQLQQPPPPQQLASLTSSTSTGSISFGAGAPQTSFSAPGHLSSGSNTTTTAFLPSSSGPFGGSSVVGSLPPNPNLSNTGGGGGGGFNLGSGGGGVPGGGQPRKVLKIKKKT
jgi:hypothetical protein